MNFKILVLFICTFFALNLDAQTTNNFFKLIDPENQAPIAGATFSYANKQSTSDRGGIILFNYKEDETMTISHLNYGSWEISASELKEAIKNRQYTRKHITVNLYPVTIIQVKHHTTEKDQVELQSDDRLEHDGAALLMQIPAISGIKKSGAYGIDPVFRGFKYEQLNIVINGAQSALAACPNRMDPPTSQVAPNMMDRIEIIKGPYALRYGTGIGATINFISEPIQVAEQSNFYGRVSTGYQNNGTIKRGELNIGNQNKVSDINIFSSWSEGNDYISGNGTTIQSDFSRGSFGSTFGYKFSENQTLNLSATYNRARDTDFPGLAMDLREDDTFLLNGQHEIKFSKDHLKSVNTTVFGSFVDHIMDNLLKPLNPRIVNATATAQTQNYGARSELNWNFNSNKLFAGIDYKSGNASGIRTREMLMGPMAGMTMTDNIWQNSKIEKASAFAEYHLNKNNIKYVFSSRLEFNHARSNDPDNKFIAASNKTAISQLNPNFSVGIIAPFTSELKTGIWLGRVQRSGGLAEKFINYLPIGLDPYELIGNPELKPEVNNQIDFTFDWQQTKTVLNFDIFLSYLQNYISSSIDNSLTPRLPMSPGIRRFTNIESALKTGFELSWYQVLPLNLESQFSIAYTYGQNLDTKNPLPEIAPMEFRYSIVGSYFKNKLKPELKFRHALKQSRISEEFGENETPAFTVIDVKIAYFINKKFSLNCGIDNLLNKNYYEHLTRNLSASNTPIYMPGRNVYINLSLKF